MGKHDIKEVFCTLPHHSKCGTSLNPRSVPAWEERYGHRFDTEALVEAADHLRAANRRDGGDEFDDDRSRFIFSKLAGFLQFAIDGRSR